MKKTLLIISLLLVAGGLIWKYYIFAPAADEEKEKQKQPQIVSVKRGDLKVVVEATGRVIPEQEVEIKCKASGEIIKLPVDVSDMVKKGDLLLQLDPDDEERSVKQAEVTLAGSEARLSQSKLNLKIAERDLASERIRSEADLKSAEAKLKETAAKLARAQQLFEKKMISSAELDTIQSGQAQAAADLENARARIDDLKTKEVEINSKREDIEIAVAQVESDQLSLSDARERLKDTKVAAPIDGVVSGKNVQIGQIIASGISNVGGGTTVLSLADLSRIYVLVAVDESDIGKIVNGQPAQIMVDAHPDTIFRGQVMRVATKGTITANVVTFEVKVEVTGENKRLLMPEMTANVEIAADQKHAVLLVPVAAIERRQQNQIVWMSKPDGSLQERTVETGVSDGASLEILSGLMEGEKVILIPEEEWQEGKEKKPGGASAHKDVMRMRMMGGKSH
ncbi:MAG: efflux RND transporter periplasmic adaptor subunit [Candidatus Schekmanbacteria bacterium]|nr:efflux RND transporter periplasmic adaptor subunit [Candidatus Schekmanbacteria bacterium]